MLSALTGFATSQALGMAMGVPPLQRFIAQGSNAAWQNAIPDPATLAELTIRGIMDPEPYQRAMAKWGYDGVQAWAMLAAAQRILDAEGIVTLARRESWPEDYTIGRLQRAGFTKDAAEELWRLSQYFPQPADLVRFAVREVYSPEIRTKYGLDEAFPPEFAREAAKVGMNEEQARNYWAAHWVLPSVSMGYEMLHRGVITSDELDVLMRTQDIMPYWREKLKQISYAPYTRVDVRRMRAAGILSYEQVLRAYKDLGYDDEHAKNLADWTEASLLSPERDLTRAMVLDAYHEGEINRDEVLAYLERLGYDSAEADLIVTLKEHDMRRAEVKETIESLRAQYKAGKITDVEFRDGLDALNLRAAYRDKVYYSTVREVKPKIALPGKDDLDKWLIRGVITPAQYVERMQKLGYVREDILNFLKALQRLPTRADLDKWKLEGIVTWDEWTQYYRALGFSDQQIEKYRGSLEQRLAGE